MRTKVNFGWFDQSVCMTVGSGSCGKVCSLLRMNTTLLIRSSLLVDYLSPWERSVCGWSKCLQSSHTLSEESGYAKSCSMSREGVDNPCQVRIRTFFYDAVRGGCTLKQLVACLTEPAGYRLWWISQRSGATGPHSAKPLRLPLLPHPPTHRLKPSPLIRLNLRRTRGRAKCCKGPLAPALMEELAGLSQMQCFPPLQLLLIAALEWKQML